MKNDNVKEGVQEKLKRNNITFSKMADDLGISLIYLFDLLKGNRGYGDKSKQRLKEIDEYLANLK